MEIDEEGQEAVLTVLRITRKYKNTTLLEGIVARATLAAASRAELLRFFMVKFDPQHWDLQGNLDDGEDDHAHVKDAILNHPWLVTANSASEPRDPD